MHQCSLRFSLALVPAFLVSAALTAQDPFVPGCSLPFNAPATHPAIDNTCPKRGDVPDPAPDAQAAAHALQNEAKNNFCASGDATLVTFSSFKKLQTKLDQKVPAAKHWTRDKLPEDRSVFLDIHTTTDDVHLGEGTVVRFSAWLMRRRPSWEIHPVYDIDVCKKKSLQSCKADDAEAWTPLAEWSDDGDAEGPN